MGSESKTDKNLPQSPFTGKFLNDDICIDLYVSNLSTVYVFVFTRG
jgi:hypothetical protein